MNADQVYLTRFRHRQDTEPRGKRTTWAELQEVLSRHIEVKAKTEAPLWSPSRYGEQASRGNAGVVDVSVFVADIDDGTDAQTVGYWLERHAHVIVSTFSHTPEHPKLRAVVRLQEAIPNDEYPDVWRRVNQHLFHGHLDPSTRDPARMYFVPSSPPGAERLAVVHAGEPLDWRSLPPVPIPRPLTRVRIDGLGSDASDDSKRAHGLLGKFARDLATTGEGERHFTLLLKARAAGGLVASGLLGRQVVESALLDASVANGEVEKYGEADVLRAIRDGIAHGAQAPWVPDDLPDSPDWHRAPPQTPPPTEPPLRGGEVGAPNLQPPTPFTRPLEVGFPVGIDAVELRAQELLDEELPSLSLLGRADYIVVGWSNLLAAYPRTGKTELLCACIPTWLAHGHTVLYLTEEPQTLWHARLRRRAEWPRGCRLVPALGIDPAVLLHGAMEAPEDIIVVDAIRNLLAFTDENDNSEVARKINPWVVGARQTSKTLELVHHLRKGAGEHGEGIAGGHALLGAVDIALELLFDQHGVPNRRRIRAWARLIQPPELLYEQNAARELVALGDPAQLEQSALELRLLDGLSVEEWFTTKEILAGLGDPKPSQEVVRRTLAHLARSSRVDRVPPISVEAAGKIHRWALPGTPEPHLLLKGLTLGGEVEGRGAKAPES